MGELDDALAGLRAEVLAATATDFERVRRARRSLLARRATASALALALIGGGAAFALSRGGVGGDDSIRYLNPTPTPSASGSDAPDPTAPPVGPGDGVEFTSLQLDGADGILLGKRCDADRIECALVVHRTRDGGDTFDAEHVVARGTQDPDAIDASAHMAGKVVRDGDVTWLWGPSLFRSTDGAAWQELPIRGFVTGLVRDETGTVAVVERCAATFPTYTDCSLVTVDVTTGTPRDLASSPVENGSHVADVAGTPSRLLVELGQEDGISHELVGSAATLSMRRSVCAGQVRVEVVAVARGFTAICGEEPGGPDERTTAFSTSGGDAAWTSLGVTTLTGNLGEIVATPYGLLALGVRGPVQRSDDGRQWEVVLPELDGEVVIAFDATVSNGRITLLSNDNDLQRRRLWSSDDGRQWTGRPLPLPIA